MQKQELDRPFAPNPPDAAGIISWVHLGDLHMVRAREQNHLDLAAIVDELNAAFTSSICFVYLPGDIADDGSRAAYSVVRHELDRLHAPWCAIIGDHDVHEKSFANFLASMAPRTHYAFTIGNVRFIAMNAFDIPEPPSFTVNDDQLAWVKRELQTATGLAQTKVIFLHGYPSDLKVGRAQVETLVRDFSVRLIDMGHTHYNEIANDGLTLYTATRSTGQIEEGPAGFSVTNIDHGTISWRFFELHQLPAILITSPADVRLLTSHDAPTHTCTVRAKIFTATEITHVTATLQDRPTHMHRIPNTSVWQADIDTTSLPDGLYPITVHATDASGRSATDTIHWHLGNPATPRTFAPRDQDNALEAWPEHGLLATQLGPNKNGKKW